MASLPGFTHANSGTSYYALKSEVGAVSNWATFPAVAAINASGYSITNASSLQIDDQVLTALSGELLLNGVPIATISGISNVSDWALYPAIANVNFSNFAIQNASGITTTTLSAGSIAAASINVSGLPVVTTPSTTDINLSGNNITNAASVQIGGRTLTTTNGGATPNLLINGSNILSNWSSFTAGSAVSMGLNDINNAKDIYASGSVNAGSMNTTSSITISAQVLTTTPSALFLNGVQIASTAAPVDVSQWATFPAVANVDMSAYNIVNADSIVATSANLSEAVRAPLIVVKASSAPLSPVVDLTTDPSGTQLLVNGQPVYTGALPPSDTSNWATYPAVANVNMSGKAIFAGTDALTTNDLSMYGLNINLNAGGAGSCNINLKGNVKASANIDILSGHIVQCNVAGSGTTNKFAAATTFGDSANLGYAEVLGSARLTGFSSFYVEGGVTFDGGTTHGFKCTTAGAGIFGLARFELTPLLTYIASAGPITTASVTYNVMTALLNCRVAAGTFVTLEHGVLGGFDGIYLQNTLNQGSNTRVIMTAGGTIYNCGNMQTSNLFTPQPIQFWSNVYNPSGGAVPAPPSEGGNTITPIVYTDPNRKNTLQGNFTRWFPAYGAYTTSGGPQSYYAPTTFSNTTLLGNYSSAEFSPGGVGAYTPTWFGSGSVHIGQQTISGGVVGGVPTTATMGDQAIAIGSISGWVGNGTSNNILIGTHLNGVTGQGGDCIAIGTDSGNISQATEAVAIGVGAGYSNQGDQCIAMGLNAGSSSQGPNAIAIGNVAGNVSQGGSAVAIGNSAANVNQGSSAVAIGQLAGTTGQGSSAVAVGALAGNGTQGVHAVAIGALAGQTAQGTNSVAIGFEAGQTNQASNSFAMGPGAGKTTQGGGCIAVGYNAGESNQGIFGVAIGNAAGQFNQGLVGIAIGQSAALSNQGSNGIAIGISTAAYSQGNNSIAIGPQAGLSNLGPSSIAIGSMATVCGASYSNTIVLNATGAALNPEDHDTCYIAPLRYVGVGVSGWNVMITNTGSKEVGIGLSVASIENVISNTQGITYNTGLLTTIVNGIFQAQSTSKFVDLATFDTDILVTGNASVGTINDLVVQGLGNGGIGIGSNAASTAQGANAVGIGTSAGGFTQGAKAVALGSNAGATSQGANAVAIGANAGVTNQHSNSVIINGTGAALNSATTGALYVAPVRGAITASYALYYDTSSKEVTYGAAGPVIVAAPSFVYYVSTNGSPTGTGSITDPLSTINAALAKLASAGPVDPPGMTIYVATGAYTEDVVVPISLTLPAVSIIGMGDDTDDSKRVQIRGSITINNTEASFANTVNTVVINNIAVFAKNATTSAVTITGRGMRVYLKNGLYTQQSVSATAPLISLASSVAPPSNATNQLVIDNCSMSMSSVTASGHMVNVASGQIFSINNSALANRGTGSAINMAAGAFSGALNSQFLTLGAVMTIIQSAAGLTSLVGCTMSGRASPSVALITLGTNATLNLNESIVQNLDTTTEVNNTSRYIYTTSATGNLIVAIRSNITNSRAAATQITPFQAAVPAASQLLYFGNIYTNLTATLVGNLPAQGGANWNAVRQFNTDTYTQQIQVTATSASAIVLSPTFRGRTIILTGTTTQPFSTAQLGAADVGFYVLVHNGNGAGGGDINMTGMSGTAIIHNRTGSQNGGDVYLYWTGAALVGY
jgi:hypothetical protein